jgi:hypothetical protein
VGSFSNSQLLLLGVAGCLTPNALRCSVSSLADPDPFDRLDTPDDLKASEL